MEDNFLRTYLQYGEGGESPELFTIWCGLAGVSAVLGRRVWVDMGKFTVFPNMYTVLVAGSGKCRKSTSIDQISELLRLVNPTPNMIAQKITPEALIDALRIKDTSIDKTVIVYNERNDGMVVVDELSTFLNRQTYEAGLASLLIPFYDCKSSFEYRTKGGGSQKITNVCLSILGASTVDWITAAIPEGAIGGGLTSRIIFVYVQDPAPPVPWPTSNPELKTILVNSLQRLSMLNGRFTITPKAKELFAEMYVEFREHSTLFDKRDLAGYASRRYQHLIKIAMLLSVCERPDLVLTEQHLEGADLMLQKTELNMQLVMSLISATAQGSLMIEVFNLIKAQKRIPRTVLLKYFANRISSKELEVVIETLTHSGQIRLLVHGNTSFYEII